MNSFGVYYWGGFWSALAIGGVITWLVTSRFGTAGRFVMVVVVPVFAAFWVWQAAQSFGPNHACSYDCEGNVFFGVLLLAGLVLGIAAAATGTWARQRRRGRDS